MLFSSAIVLSLLGGALGSDSYRFLGKFSSPFCAFLGVGIYDGEKALYATSFGGQPGAVDFVPGIAKQMSNIPAIKPQRIVSDIVWPNEVLDVPVEMFGPNHIITAGGFIPPPVRTGEVLVTNVKNGTVYKVSVDERGFFYHLAEFRDVDGDGLLDIISAKTDYPFAGPGKGKMVWFKNPGSMTFPWKESLLFNGPDVFFRLHDFNGDGREEVVASIFVNKKLSIFYNDGDFANPNDWKERVIDSNLGSPFDVRISDVNNDGRLDLLVTNHQNKIEESAVFAYEVPSDPINGEYRRHILAMGFETTQPGEGQASPGSAQTFYPVVKETSGKPLIMVSGDGTQQAHLLRPLSQDPFNWGYSMETMVFVNNTVGGIAVDDANGDGYADIFIPNYDDGEINVFTFAP